MTLKPPFSRPVATPLPTGTGTRGHEFDNLDNEVGAIIADTLHNQEKAA